MENINKYNEFRFNLLLEAVAKGEQQLVLSDRLMELLLTLEHPIAEQLISSSDEEEKFNVTLLDYHDTDIDKFVFTASNKAVLEPQRKDMWTKNRVPSKIGKTIVKLYADKFPNTGSDGIESFVDEIKIARTKSKGNFKIVEGDDIVKYYNKETYAKFKPGSILGNSCMGYDKCTEYIKFYVKNNEKMLVLFGDDNIVVRGRAILWEVDDIDDQDLDEPRTFMDRVYTIDKYEVGKFIEYAKQNDFLYKDSQDAVEKNIHDPLTGESSYLKMKIYDIKKHKAYPFMDTMKFYNSREEIISNDYGFDYNMTFESTEGGYLSEDDETEYSYSSFTKEQVASEDLTWSDVENRNLVREEGLEWSDNVNSYVSSKYAEEYWFYSMEEHDWFPNHLAVKIEGTDIVVSESRANRDYAYVAKTKKYYRDEDVKFSYNEGEIHIPNDLAVKVFEDTDLEEDLYDYRYKDRDDYFIYMGRGANSMYFDISLIDEFVKVYQDEEGTSTVYMLKEKDKDRYFNWDNKYWNSLLDEEKIKNK